MRRVLTITLILAVVIGVSVAGYTYLRPAEPKTIAEDPNIEIVRAEVETLVDTVNATGRIEPKAEVDMKFKTGGVVEEVLVERGQLVAAGTVLARLNTEDMEIEIERAKIDLKQQQAELDKLFEPSLPEKIASAQAQLQSARLKLAELVAGPDQDEITASAAELRRKEVALQKAQWAYDQVAYRDEVGMLPQATDLQEATLNYEAALAEYNLAVQEPTEAEIAEARSTVVNAEATLAELLQGPSPADVAARQASVERGQLDLAERRQNLEDAVLVSPTDGLLLTIDIEPGERVLNEADEAAMVIADVSAYLLKVEVDEIDIGRIARSQKAAITLDALPDKPIEGHVVDISPSPIQNDADGIVMFEVTVAVEAPAGVNLLPGMTATSAIETQRFTDAVVIPSRAIQFDRESNPPVIFVEKLNGDDETARVEIALGLRSGSMTQVVAGLEAGDEVIVRTQPGVEPSPEL